MSLRNRHFQLGDSLSREEREKIKNAGHMTYSDHVRVYRPSLGNFTLKDGLSVMARSAGEKRPPKKGEWYLSGAVVTAYRAPNDLSTEYHIAKLVVVETKTTTHRKELQAI